MQLVTRQGNDSPIQIAAEDNDKSDQNHGSSKGKLYKTRCDKNFKTRLSFDI